jgi:hypothetical protein
MATTDQQILDALRNAMFQLATSGAQTYTILGRTFTRLDITDLQNAIDIYERRVAVVNNPGINGGTILIGFGNPQ